MLGYPARLLFGDDRAKTDFKESKDTGIPRLYTERHISAADHRYWVQFTTLFESTEDVCGTLSIAELRRTAEKAPENLVTLVEVLAMHLESLVDDTHFAPMPEHNPGGFSALFASTAPPPRADNRDRTREALNCCRVLTRAIPIVYESDTGPRDDSDIDNLEKRTLWTPQTRVRPSRSNSEQQPAEKKENVSAQDDSKSASDQFIIADGDESVSDVKSDLVQDPLTRQDTMASTESSFQVTTGHALLNTIVELLFHAGFTMPWTDEQLSSTIGPEISRVHFTIWEAGIGCSVDLKDTTPTHIEHRIEVLRLLVTLLSKPIYTAPQDQSTTGQPAIDYIACSLERPVVLSFLCSLLNTVANYRQGDRWTFLSASGDPVRDSLTSLCLQTLCAVLTYEPRDLNAETPNLFLYYLTKLYRQTDFAFLATGTAKMFQTAIANTRGPFELGSTTGSMFVKSSEEHVSELLVVIWILLRHNPHFRQYMVGNRQLSLDMFSWLLYVALTNKDSPPTLVQAQLAIFILQDLTSDRTFCIQLTTSQSAADMTVPSRLLRSHGAVAMDMVIEAVFMLLTRSAGLMAPLYPALLLILDNTAPFWRNLSLISAARLEQMLEQFASPRFLLANEGNPRMLGILLDTFSRMLKEQYSTNANVVYILVRAAPIIERLESFSLNGALESLYRLRERASTDGRISLESPREMPAASPVQDSVNVADKETKEEAVKEPTESAKETQEANTLQDGKDGQEGDKEAVKEDVNEDVKEDSKEDSEEDSGHVKDTKGIKDAKDAKDAKTDGTDANKDVLTDPLSKLTTEDEPPSASIEEPKTEPAAASSSSAEPPAPVAKDKAADAPVGVDAMPPTPPPKLSQEQLDAVARSVGKNGFVPTAAWVDAWRSSLDLSVLKAALTELVPRVNAYCADPAVANSANADEKLLAFLREQTLTGVLPASGELRTSPC
ncbi:uncharacterized protein MJAP1_004359 [Malassezia japonica]|uniref:Uncharacterized protein n=1 Tax=Malassezia japonica TaxID=223818 RepID=A0AAF0FAN4_9BASI|nr:uncharacterized protein MJAP1_004359 [Malassezia japonica]WFD41362.1 hypothetical protein MJAP1_004359 [Malassezia japonica]